MGTATKLKPKRVGAVIASRLTSFVNDLKEVPKLSPDERLVLTAECKNQWHWCKDRKYRATIKGLVDMGLMRFAKHPQGDNVTGWEMTGLGRAVAAGLRRRRPAINLEGSTEASGGRKLAARPHSKGNTRTYSGRLGAAIRKRRDELGMTVKTFAELLAAHDVDVSIHAVYHWEKGLRPIPMDAVPGIAKILKVAILDLLPAK